MRKLEGEQIEGDQHKYWKLVISLIIDAIGMATYLIPSLGETSDVIWAPISGAACFLLYRGKLGLVGGLAAATEEFLPFTDIIPSLTLVWLMRYVFFPGKWSKK